MKFLNIFCSIILLVSTVIFGYYSIQRYKNNDTEGPSIQIESNVIQVSVQDDKSVFLQGVTAVDKKDGDVTESLGVESVSKFKEDKTREVRYVAFDKNNNVSKASRYIEYTDYRPIRFSIDEPLRFPSDKGNTDVLSLVHAQDCLDGDISNQISFGKGSMIYSSIPADYKISLSVENSAGDDAELPVTVTIYDPAVEKACPKIFLKKYLVYSKLGKEIDLLNNVDYIAFNGVEYEITSGRGTYDIDTSEMTSEELAKFRKEDPTVSADKFTVSGEIDYNTPGIYEVKYSIDSPENDKGSVFFTIIVEEGK